MPERHVVIGPPGCGKTTYLKRQVERAAPVFGSESVMVCSLTRAAAAEVKGRGVPLPDTNVGTLHAFAYRSLGRPVIAETKLKEWNEARPFLALSASMGVRSPEEDKSDDRSNDNPADTLYEAMNIYRHERRPKPQWRDSVQRFHDAWSDWLKETGYLDFTGMIESAFNDVDEAPCRPVAMFVDEAQDMSALEVALIDKWASECATTVLVGDSAQALYVWRGASPDAFMGRGQRRVLSQSYRVPGAVHALATAWGARLLDDVEYSPTACEGEVTRRGVSIRDEGAILRLAQDHLADPDSGTLLIQALCAYSLVPALKVLKQYGIPFHNPNRATRGDWNPLGPRRGTSTVDRLKAYLSDDQNAETVSLWLPMLTSAGVLRKGAKQEEIPDSAEAILSLFASEAVAHTAFSGSVEWLCAHATEEYAKRLSYPAKITENRGVSSLTDPPRVMVGTIHSFKGAEADHVVVSPDLSPAAYEEYVCGDSRNVTRAFYVALTRTRDRLTILEPSSRRCVELM